MKWTVEVNHSDTEKNGENQSLCDPSSAARQISRIVVSCKLGNLVFQTFQKIWIQGPKINLKTKLKIYEAHVTSVMLKCFIIVTAG